MLDLSPDQARLVQNLRYAEARVGQVLAFGQIINLTNTTAIGSARISHLLIGRRVCQRPSCG